MTTERLLTNKEVNQTHLFWYLSAETPNSYERLQAPSFCAAMAKNLKKIYGDDEEGYKEALQRHMEFFNTEGTIGAIIPGVALALEEQKVRDGSVTGEVISGIKLGLMGPIAGIGDTLIWGMSKSILLGIGCSFCLEGNPIGLVFLLAYSVGIFVIGRYMCRLGYTLGRDAITKMMQSGVVNSLITAASVLGLFMMGALSSSYVKVSTPLSFTISSTGTQIVLQNILDAIIPGILPLCAIFGIYYYFTHTKKVNYVLMVLVIVAISVICSFLGILA